MRNSLPLSVTIPTTSPLLWTWYVDDLQEASHVPLRVPPDEPRGFTFARGEQKQFVKRWDQHFRVAGTEWEQAPPGEYTIGAGLNVDAPAESGLWAEQSIRIVSE